MEKQIKKIRSFLKIFIIVSWIFTLISLGICLIMENGFLPDDFGPCHRYITNFSGRVLLVSIIESLFVYVLYGLKKVEKMSFSIYIFIFLGFLGSLIDNAGNLFGWFSVDKPYSIVWYDDFVHFSCAIIVSISLFFIYYNYSVKIKLNSSDNIFLISALACLTSFAMGTMFGIYEYYSDMYLNTYMVGGVEDAITDNLFDLSGAAVAFFLLNTKPVRYMYLNYKRG